mmetsp:Transcript_17904/g.26659  ORF Transcript_17904/g.26659 Transcript_17904/m.26659 type:complete len:470 (+) Transcript_17904:1158-2567(+)
MLFSRSSCSFDLKRKFSSGGGEQDILNIFIDRYHEQSKHTGLLKDKRVAIKANFAVKGKQLSAGSKMLEKVIAPYDSRVSQLLKEEGAILIGSTNMDEFGMGSSTTHSAFGITPNPHRPPNTNGDFLFSSGGSSGGSAVSVATQCADIAIGSDTGGSVRLPAAYCGVVGMKGTYGSISRFGLIAYASSLDCPGIFANNVHDASLAFSVLSQHDPHNDSTSINNRYDHQTFVDQQQNDLSNLRIGLPIEYDIAELSDDVREEWRDVVQLAQANGAQICPISLPSTKYALPAYYIIAPAEASSNLSRYDGVRYGYAHGSPTDYASYEDYINDNRIHGFGEEVKRRILVGTFVLSSKAYDSHYLQAQRVRDAICKEFEQAFNRVDIMLVPTAPTTAPKIQDILNSVDNPLQEYANDVMTIPSSLAGLPSISIPANPSKKTGLPIGLQLIANKYQERILFEKASIFENIIKKR